jgi:nucleoside-diphosphate-sugar epimerase
MKVLVTGASGFVGQKLIIKLLSEGHDVRVLTRKNKNNFPSNIKVFIGDLINDDLNLKSILKDCDIVFNCIGEINNKEKMWSTHVDASHKLFLAFIKNNLVKNKHWIQLSSVGAYGPPLFASQYRIVKESTQCKPKGEYEYTKTEADRLIIRLSKKHNTTYTILRPSNIVGDSMPNHSFFALLKAIKKRNFFYIGTRNTIATYVHVDDVINALILCATSINAKNQIFNLSNDCKWSEIVHSVSISCGNKLNFFCIPEKPLRFVVSIISNFIKIPLTKSRIDSLVSRTTYPCDKINKKLGLSLKYSIPEFTTSYIKKMIHRDKQ